LEAAAAAKRAKHWHPGEDVVTAALIMQYCVSLCGVACQVFNSAEHA
jgi:hypothetical protein